MKHLTIFIRMMTMVPVVLSVFWTMLNQTGLFVAVVVFMDSCRSCRVENMDGTAISNCRCDSSVIVTRVHGPASVD